MQIVIRAGGTGTRLWPCSRSHNPKQFLPLFKGGRSCVQEAFSRFTESGLVREDDVYVSIGKEHEDLAVRQLPQLPQDNFIVEPAKRDTAAAIALETIVVAGDRPDVSIASLGSDHYVARPQTFVEALKAADSFLLHNPDRLLAIACQPRRVETGYGYIKMGGESGKYEGHTFYDVEGFTEKPDYDTAKKYTESGEYLWNANFFAWTSGCLLQQFREFEPEMYDAFMRIKSAGEKNRFKEELNEVYPSVKKTAIDYAVLEPAATRSRLAVLPVTMGWSDIGSWASITDAFPPDEEGNMFEAPVINMESSDCTVFSTNSRRRIIAAIGLENLAVVDTDDALLVVPKNKAGAVKDLVERLRDHPGCSDLT